MIDRIMDLSDQTERIIGCAFKVYNAMGFGYVESVYERCMLIELSRAGLGAQAQIPLEVHYESEVVGEFIVDILVEKGIVVEMKSVRSIVQAHEVQLVNYLTALNKPIGLLLNFGPQGVQVKRKHREYRPYK